MKYFVAGSTARTAAELAGVHRKGKRGRGAGGKVAVFTYKFLFLIFNE